VTLALALSMGALEWIGVVLHDPHLCGRLDHTIAV